MFDFLIVSGLVVVVGLPIALLTGTAINESKAKHEIAQFLVEINGEKSMVAYLEEAGSLGKVPNEQAIISEVLFYAWWPGTDLAENVAELLSLTLPMLSCCTTRTLKS